MLFVALLLPLAVLAVACLLERFENRVCPQEPRQPRRSRAEHVDTSTHAAAPAVATRGVGLDAPTLRLVRGRGVPDDAAGTELWRQAS